MGRKPNLQAVQAEPAGQRYNDLIDAMKDLKFTWRRITTQLEGDLKMANIEHAGPTNKEERRKAAVVLLKGAKKAAEDAFETAINGMS